MKKDATFYSSIIHYSFINLFVPNKDALEIDKFVQLYQCSSLIRHPSVACGVIWLTARYFILGRVPIFLSPQFKECLSVVRVLLHKINTKLIKKYGYRYPLIVNLGLLSFSLNK